jgi:hypothetical protein
MSTQPAVAIDQRPRWPWVALGVGLIWTALIRAPLVLNAEDHLDSDLAVDGLTLIDVAGGHWRWHYPGTPYMGILPVFSSCPQALAWGSGAITLVSGGAVLWIGVVAATFWLAWVAFGPAVAGWSVVPLVFSSTGMIWLSGRITGGHLLTLVWHTLAFAGLYSCLTRGGRARAAALGLWCGLGLYLDPMFLFTLAGLVPTALLAWFAGARSLRSGLIGAAVFLIGMTAGLLPREIGRRVDAFDAYPSQFQPTWERSALLEHARLLAFDCLPRLIAGTELGGWERILLGRDGFTTARSAAGAHPPLRPLDASLAIVLLTGFVAALIRLARDRVPADEPARRAIGRGTLWSGILISAAFLFNRNIFNSDNYRYLIFLLTPWSLGFGLLMHDRARRGWLGVLVALLCAGFIAAVMTEAAFRWYRQERHYLDDHGIPVRRRVPPWQELAVETPASPGATYSINKYKIPADVTHVFGGYWDVYRISFLSGGRIVGIPYPMFPTRFRGWSHGLGPDQGKLLALPFDIGSRPGSWRVAGSPAGAAGANPIRVPGQWDWRRPFLPVWEADGRSREELSRLHVVVPSPEPARR